MPPKRKAPQSSSSGQRKKASVELDNEAEDTTSLSKASTSTGTPARTHTIYRVVSEIVDPEDRETGDGPIEATAHIGNFYTLKEANQAAYNELEGPKAYEQFKKDFDNDGLLTAAGVFWSIGHSIRVARAKVTKEKITVPGLYVVLKRKLNEQMMPGDVSVLGAFLRWADAEKRIHQEVITYKQKMQAFLERKVKQDKGYKEDFEIVHREGDGKMVFSQGVVEFKDFRDEFRFVWAEMTAMEVGEGAAVDNTEWSDDENGW